MKKKYVFVIVMLVCIWMVGSGATGLYLHMETGREEGQEFTVVTSFYPMYIAARNIIGEADGVTLQNLSEPKTGCLHDYQLTPEDMKLLSKADVFIVNGGGIESFLSDVAAAYPDLRIVQACDGIETDGDNAHVWMSIGRYEQQIAGITQGLMDADETHGNDYRQNSAAYTKKLEKLKEEAEELKRSIGGGKVILFHEAYSYLAEELVLETAYVMDLDEERQISAGEVADVIREIEKNRIPVILAEELYGKSMGDSVESETDTKVVYLDTLVRGEYEADSYLDAMRENLRIIREAYGL